MNGWLYNYLKRRPMLIFSQERQSMEWIRILQDFPPQHTQFQYPRALHFNQTVAKESPETPQKVSKESENGKM